MKLFGVEQSPSCVAVIACLLAVPVQAFTPGGRILAIGDSVTAHGVWPKRAGAVLGVPVRTHCKGGIGIVEMVDGENPLTAKDVADVDRVLLVGCYNEFPFIEDPRLCGLPADLYPQADTVCGRLNYAIGRIREELKKADNDVARIVLVSPHAYGTNRWVRTPSEETRHLWRKAFAGVAAKNDVGYIDVFEKTGVTAANRVRHEYQPGDQLHLDPEGYRLLGEAIARELKAFEPRKASLSSPDGSLSVTVVAADGNVSWAAARNGECVLKPSRLGLDFLRQASWCGFRILNERRRTIDEMWTTRLYKKERVRDHANELTLELADAVGRRMDLVFRAYDEGVAFRYVLPEQPGLDLVEIRDERTEWRFPGTVSGWRTVYDSHRNSQDELFSFGRLDEVPAEKHIGMPVVATVGRTHVALTEAALSDWAGSFYRVQPSGADETVLRSELSPMPATSLAENLAVQRRLPAASPWRVMILGDSDLDLVKKNDLIVNLNPPPDPSLDFSWVEPGVSSWDWWVDSNNGLTTERTLRQIDFAAEMGWRYHTVDSGWYGCARHPYHGPGVELEIREGFDLKRVTAQAAKKGVGVWVWIYWQTLDDAGVEESFAKLAAWGVKGVKFDFTERQDQRMVQWYERVLRAAAKHRMLVNFHGAFKPTGTERTWPNNLTREGVRGNETSKFTSEIDTVHTATLPFTRFLLGPADFTPGSFANVYAKGFVPQAARGHRCEDELDLRPIRAEEIGTRAHALALCVAYDSRLTTLCDWPERYRGQPGLEVLKNLPAAWRNTLPLAGETGSHYAVVRESFDGRWFVAALTVKARTVSVPLGFLGPGTWTAAVYADDPARTPKDAKALAVTRRRVTAAETIELNLLPEGGAVVVLDGKAE